MISQSQIFLLEVPTSTFTFKNHLRRHFAIWALTHSKKTLISYTSAHIAGRDNGLLRKDKAKMWNLCECSFPALADSLRGHKPKWSRNVLRYISYRGYKPPCISEQQQDFLFKQEISGKNFAGMQLPGQRISRAGRYSVTCSLLNL